MYRIRMVDLDSKKTLRENVSNLMKSRYGGENLTRLAADAKVGPGTVTRIKEQETSIGIDLIAKVARVFKLDPWQLLVPDLDPKRAPSLQQEHDSWPFPGIERARFDGLTHDQKIEIQGLVRVRIEKFESDPRDPSAGQTALDRLLQDASSKRRSTTQKKGGKDAA